MDYVKINKNKSRRRSYYDRLSSRIATSAFSFWMKDFKKGKKESSYFDQIEEELEFDIYCDIYFKGDKFQILDQTGADGRDEDDEGDTITPFIQIFFMVDPSWLPEYWEEIYYYLCSVIRHEIEHITQDGPNYKNGKPFENDDFLRILIDNGMMGKAEYLLLPKEIDANIQCLRFESRKRREKMIDTVNRYLNTQELSQEEQESVLRVWRDRAKKIGGIPEF